MDPHSSFHGNQETSDFPVFPMENTVRDSRPLMPSWQAEASSPGPSWRTQVGGQGQDGDGAGTDWGRGPHFWRVTTDPVPTGLASVSAGA